MIKQPAYLKKGDKVAIVCPAKKLPQQIDHAISILNEWGLEVVVGETVNAEYHQFAGTDELRKDDLQKYLDDQDIKAIIAGRGGYGTLRIIDDLDFYTFSTSPKWLVGFSDITVLLSHAFAQLQCQSIHAQMPYTFESSSPEALESLRCALFGQKEEITYQNNIPNRDGTAEGIVVGGNLTLLIALEGSKSEMDFDNKILFIEDVGEHEYAVDRMMRTLKRKGKLANLAGLIVGAFNEMTPEMVPFGQTPEQVILAIVQEYDYPVCFNFPVGHINDNRALTLGRNAKLEIHNQHINFKHI